jgi:hypothetical protein
MSTSTVTAITAANTEAWIAKAQILVDPLRDSIAATGGASRRVAAQPVRDAGQALYGNLMLSWPETTDDHVILHHLPSGALFLRLLAQAYRPVLKLRPQLEACLHDGSRLELAFTNDVLQVQAAAPPGPYSMVRHHALVMHAATHWLNEPARSRWFELYEGLASGLMSERTAPPTAEELRQVEESAFVDFRRFAADTVDAGTSSVLLADHDALRNILQYTVFAGVAIAVLERHRLSTGAEDWVAWMADQLAAAARDDYLLEEWGCLL